MSAKPRPDTADKQDTHSPAPQPQSWGEHPPQPSLGVGEVRDPASSRAWGWGLLGSSQIAGQVL